MTVSDNIRPAEQLLDINREIIKTELKLQRTKREQRMIRAALFLTPILFLSIYIATTLTWRTFDMAPINWIAIPVNLVMIIGLFSYFASRATSGDSPELVGDVELDLTVLRERKRFMALDLSLSLDHRRSVYKEDTHRDIESYRQDSRRYRRLNNFFQAIVIIGSLLAASLSSLAVEQEGFRWATVVSTFLVGVSAGFTGYFKFKDRGFYLQQTADALEHEWSVYDLGIGRYKRLDPGEALAEFVEVAERLRAEQRQREQNLDQPSDGREPSNQP